ncbi:MAG: glycosyltransferase [Proteobacteria bacterium]|nr:MAG: glycosyltransferase [Pseudomonadota bacterium]
MISQLLALLGLLILCYRLWPRAAGGTSTKARAATDWPLVSIVIPARNEAKNLPQLLESLKVLDYPNFETIVVDDSSSDDTADIALSYGVRLIQAGPKPDGWFGKPWACHQGSFAARGEYFLFTDADTVHRPQSLTIALEELLAKSASGLSAIPFHQNPSLWERFLGPFQLLLIALTNPYGLPVPGRVFAIGQYLLFPKVYYDKIGGHEAIKSEAIDDLSLANRVLRSGGHWQVHTGESLFEVRMYETLGDFIKGWRRNFRGGLHHNSSWSSLEVFLIFMAMTIGINGNALSLTITGLTLLVLLLTQKKLGRFTSLGVLCLPFSMGLFTLVSLLAVYDKILAKPLLWKSRSY